QRESDADRGARLQLLGTTVVDPLRGRGERGKLLNTDNNGKIRSGSARAMPTEGLDCSYSERLSSIRYVGGGAINF
ncbi:MAG: hypothetical protein ACNA77_10385, partial [Opitutales bacterium]